MQHTPSHPRVRHAGFTLIEMLAVIGIIGILTALTGLALRGINGSTSRKAAVNNLMGVFDQARIVAVSDGRPTYVVFVSAPAGQTQSNAALPDTMWGRAYALFEDPPLTDASNTTNFYPVQRSSWLYLPTGVAFKCNSTADNTPPSVTAAKQATGDATTFKVQSRSGGGQTAMTLPYVKFDATGQIVDYQANVVDPTSPTLRVLLFEGIATAAGTEAATHPVVPANTADGKKYSLDEITLKSTTGRAIYTLNPVNNLAVVTSP